MYCKSIILLKCGILLLDCKSIILLNCKYFTFIQNIVFIIINLVCILLLFLAKNRHIIYIYIAHFEDKHNDFLKIDVKRKTNFFVLRFRKIIIVKNIKKFRC